MCRISTSRSATGSDTDGERIKRGERDNGGGSDVSGGASGGRDVFIMKNFFKEEILRVRKGEKERECEEERE